MPRSPLENPRDDRVTGDRTDRPTAGRPAAACAMARPRVGRRPDSPRRWLLALLGLLCVGLAAIGVVVPGMPTTVFLIAAGWLFTRSCPWLEEKLVRHRFFAPFHRYLDPRTPMPRRARVAALAAMWTAITVSAVLLGRGGLEGGTLLAIRASVVAAGLVGTVVILRVRRGARGAAPGARGCPHAGAAEDA